MSYENYSYINPDDEDKDFNNQLANFGLSAARSPLVNYGLQAAGLYSPDMLKVDTRAVGTTKVRGVPLQQANYKTSVRLTPRFAKLALPTNAAFGLADYAIGKAEGEDDIRAGVGAVGSTIGGAIGGIAGTVLGRNRAASMAGSAAGNFLGGWLGDRADELIRGNNQNEYR